MESFINYSPTRDLALCRFGLSCWYLQSSSNEDEIAVAHDFQVPTATPPAGHTTVDLQPCPFPNFFIMIRQLSNSTSFSALSSKRFLATASTALSAVAQTHASSLSNWPGTSFSGGRIKNYIGGAFVESKANKWIEVHDPSTQSVLSRVPETTESEFEDAVGAAKEAFESWRKTSVLTRQRFVME
jgi:hypothetical protein